MSAGFTWDLLKDGLFFTAIASLLLAPLFWFLYDSDAFFRFAASDYAAAALATFQTCWAAWDHNWWLAVLFGGLAIVYVVRVARGWGVRRNV